MKIGAAHFLSDGISIDRIQYAQFLIKANPEQPFTIIAPYTMALATYRQPIFSHWRPLALLVPGCSGGKWRSPPAFCRGNTAPPHNSGAAGGRTG